jgi:putative ABC transport system permease protein
MIADLKFALRMLAKNPGFTLIAVLMLALGIGANTAVFSALNALFIRPLPIQQPEAVVCGYAMREGRDPYLTSALEYNAYREQSRSFTVSGIATPRSFNFAGGGEPERLPGAAVTIDYLTTLGVKLFAGRTFLEEEDRPGGPTVALISYELWERRFGGDPKLVGQSLTLDNGSYTVIGIFPPGFNMPFAADIWVPFQSDISSAPLDQRAQPAYDMVARLKPGVTIRTADAELKQITAHLAVEYPQIRQGWSYKLISLRQNLMGDLEGRTRKALFALVAAVAFLLLICCANLANLLLARGVAREGEISIRFALGAGPARIARQMLTESLLLALLGGAAGTLLAGWIVPLLGKLSPVKVVSLASFLRDFRIDSRVLVFSFLLSLLTAAIFGSIPAIKLMRSRHLITVIKQKEQRAGETSGGRLLDILVTAEIAMATTLLVAGGLIVQSFQGLQRIKLGFRPDNLLTVEMQLPPSTYRDQRARVAFAQQLLERVRTLPGVVSAGTTTNFPMQLYDAASSFTVEDAPAPTPDSAPMTIHRLVGPGYLKTIGATLLRGRDLSEQDTMQTLPVVVINEELARQAWPNQDPIGKRIRRGRAAETNNPWLTVIGVVANVKEDRFNFRTDRPVWYLGYAQEINRPLIRPLILAVRTDGNPANFTGAIRSAIHAVDPNQAITSVTIMKAYLAEVLMRERFSALLMGTLAMLGLILAALGLYGVMAYSVARRTGEIGLRMALGAASRDIFHLVLGRALALIGCGLVIGLLGALGMTRGLSAMLYQISPTDPFTFTAVAMLLATVALLACYLPARWATHVDPMEALRCE